MDDEAFWGGGMWGGGIWGGGIWGSDPSKTRFSEVLAQLEKKNVSTNWIDYEWIEAGLADHTPLDEVLARLQK